jgi:hypothetical protein
MAVHIFSAYIVFQIMQIIHGLVDRIMEVVGVPFVSVGDDSGYYIRPSHVRFK